MNIQYLDWMILDDVSNSCEDGKLVTSNSDIIYLYNMISSRSVDSDTI